MKKILMVMTVMFSMLFAFNAHALTVKALGAYGTHLSPDLGTTDAGLNYSGVAQTLLGSGKFKVGTEVGYNQIYDYRVDYSDGSYTEFKLYTMNVLGIAQIGLMTIGKVTPYIQAGAGVFRTTATVDDSYWGTVSTSEMDFGATGAVGVNYPIKEGVDADLGVKLNMIMMGETYTDLYFYAGVAKDF